MRFVHHSKSAELEIGINVYDQVIDDPFYFFYAGLIYQALHSFSMIRNIKSTMNTNVGKRDLTYLHGIRVLSLFWIILLHISTCTAFYLWPYGKQVNCYKEYRANLTESNLSTTKD